MRRIIEVGDGPLTWRQPSALRMEYELRAGEETVADLRFRSSLGTLATGQSGDGSWTFKRVGFWRPRVTVRATGDEAEIASAADFTFSGGCTIGLNGGRRLLGRSNVWGSEYSLRSPDDEPLIHYRASGLLHLSGEVTLTPAARDLAELPWLVLLGWYLYIMLTNDSSVAAAAT